MAKSPILLVTDVTPIPEYTGSNLRVKDLIRHLHESGQPLYVLLQRTQVEWETIAFLKQYTTDFFVTPNIRLASNRNSPRAGRGKKFHNYLVWHLSQSAAGNRGLNLLRRALGRPPVTFGGDLKDSDGHCSPETQQTLQTLNDQLNPRAIIVVYAWMAECLQELNTQAKLILDTIDVMHQRVERLKQYKLPVGWCICRDREMKILSQFDAIIAIQDEEAEVFRAMVPEKRVITVGTSHPLLPAALEPMAGRLLFIGGPNAGNIMGMESFLKEVWPGILKARPEAELAICGKIGGRLKTKAPRLLLQGFVEDVGQAYNEAAVVINPLWVGSGLKIKTVEALCRGKALVTTPCGIEGMVPPPEGACRVVEQPEQMAKAIIELLREPEKRKALESAAYDYARQWLSPSHVYRQLDELLNG